MKRILIAILFLTLSFSIIGCSASSSTASSSDSASGSEEKMATTEETMKSKSMQPDVNSSDNVVVDKNENDTNNEKSSQMDSVDSQLDVAVGKAIIDTNDGTFLEGEVKAEGHIILQHGTLSDDSEVVYALTMYGEYGFQNDALIKISGTGSIPTVLTFVYNKDSGYTLKSYTVPNDGSGYIDSVKEMFPKDLYNYVLSVSDSDLSSLQAQERKYAKAYLNKIDRSAVIGDSADIKFDFPQISSEASSEIFKRYWEYPSWIGTEEKLESGVRYVYETQWKNYGNDDSMVYFTKYVYGTGEIIKSINVYIEDGVVQSSAEKVTRIIENSTAAPSVSLN